jgi:hypothetical protein
MQQRLMDRLLVGLVALVILLAAFMLTTAINDRQPPAQPAVVQIEAGRKITADDWGDHLWVAGLTVAVVIGVNGIFIKQIIRQRQSRQVGR